MPGTGVHDPGISVQIARNERSVWIGMGVQVGPAHARTFVPLPEPTTADIEALTLRIARRLTAVVERLCGLRRYRGLTHLC
jgi:hypothetical protein